MRDALLLIASSLLICTASIAHAADWHMPPLPRPTEAVEQVPTTFPAEHYLAAIARGEPVFRIDAARSLVVIEVRRAGSLARLGHDHVVASHDVQGYVAPKEGMADLYVPLDRLIVDEPALRVEAGFDTTPSDADIAGTRANMLARVLEVERYPFALVTVSDVAPAADNSAVQLAMTLHGITRTTRIPIQIGTENDEIAVNGSIVVKQTDFGIAPLSILGGAIQVQNEVNLRFQLRARRCFTQSCR
jgi:hypothetical protein